MTQLPVEIAVKITLLITDENTLKSWLECLPILKNIPVIVLHRKRLRKKDFMLFAKCRCYICWRDRCKGDEDISYFKLVTGDWEETYYPSQFELDNSETDEYYTDWRGIHRCRHCEAKREWAMCKCNNEGYYIDDYGKDRCTTCDERCGYGQSLWTCSCDRYSESDESD